MAARSNNIEGAEILVQPKLAKFVAEVQLKDRMKAFAEYMELVPKTEVTLSSILSGVESIDALKSYFSHFVGDINLADNLILKFLQENPDIQACNLTPLILTKLYISYYKGFHKRSVEDCMETLLKVTPIQ